MMNNATFKTFETTDSKLHAFEAEKQIIDELTFALKSVKTVVTNKDLILALISRLETESDVVQNDILRNALEIIVHRTQDDI